MTKWFWGFLQWISTPSEKEIRESVLGKRELLALLLIFLMWAPAYANAIKSPEQCKADITERQQDNIRRHKENIIAALMDRAYVVKRGKTKVIESWLIVTGLPTEAVESAIEELMKAGWIVHFAQDTITIYAEW